jgi:hypothetical protein
MFPDGRRASAEFPGGDLSVAQAPVGFLRINLNRNNRLAAG